ncbi:cubilin-like [Cydia fagiglandana]|uniref:cubilin-like n=1 Tax=Cydia fagiglandana TaxID=1458189 RepID=UPI002FEE517F
MQQNAGTVYWLGARSEDGRWDNFTWSDGSAVGYRGWQQYNESDERDACLGVQWKSSPVPSQPSGLFWTLHKCSATGGYVCKRRLSEVIVKNRTVEGSSGTLTSPEHPNLYDNDLDYWVHVVGPPDTRLVFVFQRIDLEFQKDCLYDYVELRDTLNLKSSRYCGTVGETRWVASSNKAVLHFHSDYNTQASGFSLIWQAVELVGCPSQTFTSKEGVLRSPHFPHFLLPDLDCTVDILAPAGKRVFLNITYLDFGHGTFEKGLPSNLTDATDPDSFLEVQVDLQDQPIRPFTNPDVFTSGLFVSTAEVMRVRFKTGRNVSGKGFQAYFKTMGTINVTHTLELHHVRSGRLSAPNWPRAPPPRFTLRTRLIAPHDHTLSVAFAKTTLASGEEPWPCGEGRGWIEVKDSYTDNNGTQWTLCEADRAKRRTETPLVINSYLHSLTVTQCAGENGVHMDVALLVNKDPDYHSKVLLLSEGEDTYIESCYPNPCVHDGFCATDDTKNFCQCAGYYTGMFCLLNACERSPCVFGNCTLSEDSFLCLCARGWLGRRCAERVRPCAARPCNNRGACSERDGGFLCQCNPSWKGKR